MGQNIDELFTKFGKNITIKAKNKFCFYETTQDTWNQPREAGEAS